jgi:hypothetical protein
MCNLCVIVKHPSLFDLMKNDPSAIVNPTIQLLKNFNSVYPIAVEGNSNIGGITFGISLYNFISFFKINIAVLNCAILVLVKKYIL